MGQGPQLTRLDYPGAAEHFKVAAELVSKGGELVLADYLMREGSALGDAGRYRPAEESVERALGIHEKALGPEHPAVATSLNNLAALYNNQGRYAEAEPLYQRRALAIYDALPPPPSQRAATVRQSYAAMLEKMNADHE